MYIYMYIYIYIYTYILQVLRRECFEVNADIIKDLGARSTEARDLRE